MVVVVGLLFSPSLRLLPLLVAFAFVAFVVFALFECRSVKYELAGLWVVPLLWKEQEIERERKRNRGTESTQLIIRERGKEKKKEEKREREWNEWPDREDDGDIHVKEPFRWGELCVVVAVDWNLSFCLRACIHFLSLPTMGTTMKKFSELRTPVHSLMIQMRKRRRRRREQER